jgi:hypothetical protein
MECKRSHPLPETLLRYIVQVPLGILSAGGSEALPRIKYSADP